MAKKPWRVVPQNGETGRFTREQIAEAVRKGMEAREAKAEKGDRKGPRGVGGRRPSAAAAEQKGAEQ